MEETSSCTCLRAVHINIFVFASSDWTEVDDEIMLWPDIEDIEEMAGRMCGGSDEEGRCVLWIDGVNEIATVNSWHISKFKYFVFITEKLLEVFLYCCGCLHCSRRAVLGCHDCFPVDEDCLVVSLARDELF